jgi:hypothetical protein
MCEYAQKGWNTRDVGIEKSAWGGTARRNKECQTLELFSPKALKETQGGFLK